MAVMGSFIGTPSGRVPALGHGEWLSVNIAGYMSQPRLIEGQLTPSDESKLDSIKQVGQSFSYSPQDNLRVPEAFTFRWRAEGDAQMQERVFRVRSRLPKDVLEKITMRDRAFKLGLDFRVRNSQPELMWRLVDLRGPKGKPIEPLISGVITPE